MLRKLTLALLAALALWSTPSPAQQPITFPNNTVYGRGALPAGPGPGQAIPFATLTSNLFSSLCTTDGAIPIYNGGTGTWVCSSGGISSNRLNPQVGAYAAVVGDCGKTVSLGGAASYALTVGAASGFPTNCVIDVINTDSGRAKAMSINGVSFPNSGFLWPLQSFKLANTGSAWVVRYAPGRWKLAASLTLAVDAAGSDSANDCLATGASGACKTITGAVARLNVVDAAQFPILIQPTCGGPTTYNENVLLLNVTGASIGGSVGSANPTLIGDTTTPTNCIINGSGTVATVLIVGQGTNDWVVRGFKITNSGTGNCVQSDAGAWLRLGEMEYGSCGGTLGLQPVNNGTIEPMKDYAISANFAVFAYPSTAGKLLHGGTVTVTLKNLPAMSSMFALSDTGGIQQWSGIAFKDQAGHTRTTGTGNLHTNTTLDNLSINTNTLTVGMAVIDVTTGANIPANTTVSVINSSSSVTISNAATGTSTGDTFNFEIAKGLRQQCTLGGGINVAGAGSGPTGTFFPGTVNGSACTTGAWYN